MKRLALILLAGIAISSPVRAAEPAASVIEILRSTNTCRGAVAISSATVGVSTVAATLYAYVSVENESSTVNLWCRETVNVSTSGANAGFKLLPLATATWTLVPGMSWFCQADGPSATASICKGG